MSEAVFEMLNSEEKRRYIADHAPGILAALITRRSSSDPHTLLDLTIATAAMLYDAVTPLRRNGHIRNGVEAHSH
jgi:hypothetical protein